MGVVAPVGIKRFYYVAYPVGLIIAFGAFYLVNVAFPSGTMPKVSGWKEPKNHTGDYDEPLEMVVESVDTTSQELDHENLSKNGVSSDVKQY